MNDNSEKWSIKEIKTRYYVFAGSVIGAILGLVAYVKDWL
ncbi:hypothetical protein C7437_11147 [Psychrobacillus insolitus]|uniref:Uncharacterized protein n=1 Tax=Psychrobacillus insolitus TaxID=1461 RepID=A0A2W7MEN1_9BACI|nr:hypothetical protein C7437_11147 [Psychrobacillus insolitus]